jgi:aerobic carbon-monoxide dehydrogenase small subunit
MNTTAAEPDDVPVEVEVNGRPERRRVEPRQLLVEFLRNDCRLTGTHVGCDTSYCGACTVLLDGRAVKSCTVLTVQASGHRVRTVEGLERDGVLDPLQQAFGACHALQCGYCTPGFLMAATELLARNPTPSGEQIRAGLSGNVCRCTGYLNIVQAVERAAARLREDRESA